MAGNSEAIRKAVLEATRLHNQLGITAETVAGSDRIDVYGSIAELGVPLVFAKLEGLLGAYYRDPSPGILVTTQRPLSQQRFTAAHELGHHYLGHAPSLDDETLLARAPFAPASNDPAQEVEAEAFAATFLFPRWLLNSVCDRHNWTDADLNEAVNVYQLALRVGTSYEAAVWTLLRYRVFDSGTARRLANVELKKIKQQLLRGYQPKSYRGDVWLLTDRDAEARVHGGPEDLFVVRLHELSGSGYIWRVEALDGGVLALISDDREAAGPDNIGGPTIRRIVIEARERGSGQMRMAQVRPWLPHQPTSTFAITYELHGAEQGWFRHQRQQHRQSLEAA